MEATSETTGGFLRNYSGGTLRFVKPIVMTRAETAPQPLLARPKRADARRNYEKVLAAAREAFAEGGESTALEEIARRAGVGIGTLYRNFPNRQALLETLYLEEVEGICRMAEEQRESADPWEALTNWFERFIGYIATKQALAAELTNYLDRDAQLFKSSRAALWAAGEPLLTRAQEAGVVRPDAEIGDVMHMVMGIAKVPAADPSQTTHIVRMALDGLRYRPDA
jgi:AcrR family transcriptional regulator